METATIIDFVFKGFLAICQLALFVYVRNTNRNDEVDKRFVKLQKDHETQGTKLSSEVGALGQRISHLETAVDSAPNHSDLTQVYDSINRLAATVNQLVGENRGQSDTLRLILNRITEKGMK